VNEVYNLVNIWNAKLQEKVDRLMCSVRLDTVLLKYEELVADLEYDRQQMLLTVDTLFSLGLNNHQTGVDQF